MVSTIALVDTITPRPEPLQATPHPEQAPVAVRLPILAVLETHKCVIFSHGVGVRTMQGRRKRFARPYIVEEDRPTATAWEHEDARQPPPSMSLNGRFPAKDEPASIR
jgi:hypothetical protein